MKFNVITGFKNATNCVLKTGKKYESQCWTGLGIAGYFVSIALTIKATRKVDEVLKSKKEEKGSKLTKEEIVLATYKHVAPPVILSIAATACILNAQRINAVKIAALTAGYNVVKDRSDIKDKLLDQFVSDDKKLTKAEDPEDQAIIDKTPFTRDEPYMLGQGKNLFLDEFSGRYFLSSVEEVKKAFNDFNANLMVDEELYLNDLYEHLNMEAIGIGDCFTFNYEPYRADKGFVYPRFSGELTKDGTPCVLMKYSTIPSAV